MTKSTSEIIEQMRHERRVRIGLPEPPVGERQHQSPSEIIEQMRRDRRVRTGRDPLPEREDIVVPEVPVIALDPRLKALLTDRRFTALFDGMDATELRGLLEEVETLLVRCSLHHRSALWRKAIRHRRISRKRRSAEAPGRKAGRPTGAKNFSAQQYGLGLAMIWFEHTGRPPSRYEPKAAHGGYIRFVELVVEAAPPRLRRSPGEHPPAIDYLVRTSVMSFRVARISNEEYRRRGLLDEGEWLDRP